MQVSRIKSNCIMRIKSNCIITRPSTCPSALKYQRKEKVDGRLATMDKSRSWQDSKWASLEVGKSRSWLRARFFSGSWCFVTFFEKYQAQELSVAACCSVGQHVAVYVAHVLWMDSIWSFFSLSFERVEMLPNRHRTSGTNSGQKFWRWRDWKWRLRLGSAPRSDTTLAKSKTWNKGETAASNCWSVQ